ncbi:MAG: hypothetical protein PG977_000340 [Bartonella clarridgeiae]|nr:MAG: hypothetical protein PG977_000340 [Bartonella clarridgeiae]
MCHSRTTIIGPVRETFVLTRCFPDSFKILSIGVDVGQF